MKKFDLVFKVEVYADSDEDIPLSLLRNQLNTILFRECRNSFMFRDIAYTLTWKDEK